MEERKLISININGLNIPTKRSKIFHRLEKLKYDIVCLQETHIKKQHEYLLNQPKIGKLYTTLAQTKKRGVALYIRDTISAKLIYTDDDGRILMVEIMDNNIKTLLIAIYAPNNNQEDFYRKLHMQIVKLEYSNLYLMGDLNGIVDEKRDHQTQSPIKKKRKILPKSFFQMVEELNLKDIWRERNMDKKQYTYYSNRHASWSRIDMIWSTADLLFNIQDIEIETSIWADHNPTTMVWKGLRSRPRWTLNNRILKEEDFKLKMEKELSFFLQENKKEDTSLQNVWDTMKAYARGVIIDYTRKKNQKQRKNCNLLEKEHTNLEKELQIFPPKKDIKFKMDVLKHKIELIEKGELAQKIKSAKQNYFEDANKPGRWLAYKLKKRKTIQKD